MIVQVVVVCDSKNVPLLIRHPPQHAHGRDRVPQSFPIPNHSGLFLRDLRMCRKGDVVFLRRMRCVYGILLGCNCWTEGERGEERMLTHLDNVSSTHRCCKNID